MDGALLIHPGHCIAVVLGDESNCGSLILPNLLLDYLKIVPRLKRRQHRDIEFAGVDMGWQSVAFSSAHYQRYLDFFDLNDARETARVHPLYFYVLGQQAQLQLLAHKDFPFAPAGLVHLSNDVTLHGQFDAQQDYDLSLTARLVELNKAGFELEFITQFSQQGEIVVSNRTTAMARAPLRRKRGQQAHNKGDNEAASLAEGANESGQETSQEKHREVTQERRREVPEALLSPSVSLAMPAKAGRQYAKVSGDYNPIHLSQTMARWFGFRHAIAHGMYSLMRVVSVVERQEGMQAQQINARFVRPVFLPSVSGLAHDFIGAGCRFELSDEHGHLQLVGDIL